MKKESFVLFAGCVLIVGGSLVLSSTLFPQESVTTKTTTRIEYADPIKIEEDGDIQYVAPKDYETIYTNDGVICYREVPVTISKSRK